MAFRSTNRVVDSMNVQEVLGPPVDRAGHHPEEVLHARGHAGPVMGLQFWHRHDEIRAQHLGRQGNLLEAHVSTLERHVADVVLVQVDEADAMLAKVIVKAGPGDEILRVAPVSGALPEDDLRRPGST